MSSIPILDPSFIACEIFGSESIKILLTFGILGSSNLKMIVDGFFDFFSTTHLMLYTNAQVPANDGGLALGQAVLGGAHVSCHSHAR